MHHTILYSIVPGGFQETSELPFGAAEMREHRFHSTQAECDEYIQTSRALERMQEMQTLIARMQASKAFFEKYRHYVTIETESGMVFRTKFPSQLAKYSHKRELDYGQAQCARFLVSPDGMRFVTLDMAHLPDERNVCNAAKALQPLMDPNERLTDEEKRSGRIQVFYDNVDVEQDAVIEAEMLYPMPLNQYESRFRIVVHGGSGTNAKEMRSLWLSHSDVLRSVDSNFVARKSMILKIASTVANALAGTEITVPPNPTLLAGNSFVMDTGPDSPTQRFSKGIDINFPVGSNTILMTLKLVRTSVGVCIGSTTVGFRFNPPKYGYSGGMRASDPLHE